MIATLKSFPELNLYQGGTYVDPGINLPSGHTLTGDSPLETVNTFNIGWQAYTYEVRGSTGGLYQVSRVVGVVRKSSFIPATNIIVLQGDSFDPYDLNGFAYDTFFGDINGIVGPRAENNYTTSTVNTNVLGNYTITKNATITFRPYGGGGSQNSSATRGVSVIKKPLIVMNGENNISLEQYAPYIDQGASVRNFYNTSEVLANTIITSNNVDMQLPGNYTVTYSSQYAINLIRYVTVTPYARVPIINLIGEASNVIVKGTIFTEPGFEVDFIDSALVVITTSLSRPTTNTYSASSPGTYTITYNYTASYGKSAATVQRTVIVVDLPVITLTGSTSIPFGLSNDDPGYIINTATTTLVSSTAINTLILGPQTITYTVKLTDHPHITNTASRIITIVDVTAPIITLLDPIPARLGSNIQAFLGFENTSEKVVTLSANGTVMALSSISDNKTSIYKYESGEWKSEKEILNVSGNSISLNSDGTVLAVLTVLNGIKIYKNSGGVWGSMVNFDKTGRCVTLNADGTIIAVGGDNITNIYKYSEDIKLGQDILGEATGDMSGYSVSINAAGGIVAIGAI